MRASCPAIASRSSARARSGCLVAWLAAQIPVCDVELVDTNRARAAVARALGVAFAEPGAATGEADVVVHASGTGAGLAAALALAGLESTVVDLSWYGDQSVALPLGGAFHSRRLTIKSSQVGQVAPAISARAGPPRAGSRWRWRCWPTRRSTCC